jgi:hypothetical protein
MLERHITASGITLAIHQAVVEGLRAVGVSTLREQLCGEAE